MRDTMRQEHDIADTFIAVQPKILWLSYINANANIKYTLALI